MRMSRLRPLAVVLSVLAAPAVAEPVEVDLELALMVDVSRSMTPRELEIQRRGYATALRSQDVWDAVAGGMLGRVALAYIEWAGGQEVVVDWRLVETRADLLAFADALTARFDPGMRRTSISGALEHAAAQIAGNGFAGLRQVIDVSGDGPNNLGRPVLEARAEVLEAGLTINGLPLMTREGTGAQWHLDRLDIYYRTCVIGGPGAFLIPVVDWDDFAEAVERKLVLEIAGLPAPAGAPVVPAQSGGDPTDCLVGEKIWRQRWGDGWWP